MRMGSTMFCLMLAALALPAGAASVRHSIGADEVAAAIRNMGVPIDTSQVTLLAEVVSNSNTPHLKVRSLSKWGDGRMMARMECETAGECLPFLVGVKLNSGMRDQAVRTQSAPAAIPAVPAMDARSYLVRSGEPTMLLLEGPHVQIRIPVVCLENGLPGQKVRVRSTDRHQVYFAQVVDATLLKGTL